MSPIFVKLGMLIFEGLLYPLIRKRLQEAVERPDKKWNEEMMGGADEVFNKNKE